MTTDLLRVASNERVDISDFRFVAKDSLDAAARHAMSGFAADPDRARKWILDGFAMSNPTGKQLQVARGRAILARRDGGIISYGALVTEGDATKIVDLNTYSAGTYGIYVRFEFLEGDVESRIFWNPAGVGAEYAASVPTRYQANWGIRVEASSPGDEWLKIGEVNQASMAITDMRPFYFEGTVNGTYPSGWSSDGGGSANDRNANRALYGVGDVQMFSAAVRQCLEDIKGRGLRRWWSRDIGGMNIGFDADPEEGVLAVGDSAFGLNRAASSQPTVMFDGADAYLEFTRGDDWFRFGIAGLVVLEIQTSGLGPGAAGQDFGFVTESGLRWRTAYLENLDLDQTDGHGVINNLKPAVTGTSDLGSTTRKWKDLHLSGSANVAGLVNALGANFTSALSTGYLEVLSGIISDLVPSSAATRSLGSTAREMLGVYSKSVFWRNTGATPGEQVWRTSPVGGVLSWYADQDNYAAGNLLMTLDRTGYAAYGALLKVFGRSLVEGGDSGYPTTWLPALEVTGVTPFIRLTDDDPLVDPQCSRWGIWTRKGTADGSVLSIGSLDQNGVSYGINGARAIQIYTRGGSSDQWAVDLVEIQSAQDIWLYALNADVEITASNGEVALDGTVSVQGDNGVPSAADWALTGGISNLVGAPVTETVQVNGGLDGNLVITGWIKIYFAGGVRYLPVVTTITP